MTSPAKSSKMPPPPTAMDIIAPPAKKPMENKDTDKIVPDIPKSNKLTPAWIQWFQQLVAKINVLDPSAVALLETTGSGFISTDPAGSNARTITGTAGRLTVTNGDGVAGNPTLDVADDIVINRTVLAGDVVNANVTPNTIADVTALSFAVISGKTYWFDIVIPYTSAAITTGSLWSINGPATTLLNFTSRYTLTATTETVNYCSAYDTPVASNAASLTVGNVARLTGILTTSAAGTVIVRFASGISSSAITAKAGSVIYWQQLN